MLPKEQYWEERIFPKIIAEFSPRIQSVLKIIPELSIEKETESLYIQGKVGSGKTILAVQMYVCEKKKYWFEQKVIPEMYFINMPELFIELQECYKNNQSTKEILDKYSTAYLVIFDDLGVERNSEWSWNILYLIINRRYEGMLKTIFTSNLNLEELANKLGDDRVSSRISRMCKIYEGKNSYTN